METWLLFNEQVSFTQSKNEFQLDGNSPFQKKTIQGALIQLSFEEKLPSIQKKSGFHRKNK